MLSEAINASGSEPIGPYQASIEKMRDLLTNIILNARIQPDAAMSGTTDTYAVPVVDIEAAREALTKLST